MRRSFTKTYRWRIVALLFFATTINYIDRNVLSFAMIDDGFRHTLLGLPDDVPLSVADINLFKERIGFVDAAFKTAYAFGFLLVGWFIDSVGTRKGFSWSIVIWSVASVAHGFVSSFRAMAAARFMLGFGEAGNFPSAIKSVAEWFPKKERAFATGIFNAGSSVGIILTALLVPWITIHYGWRLSFIVTGSLGLILWLAWRALYRRPEEHGSISTEELAYIADETKSSDEPVSSVRVPWRRLLSYRQTWALAICKFMADPIWWFFLTWLPDFFNSNESLDDKLDLRNIGLSFFIIYLVSDLGSIFFGWLSSRMIQSGISVNRARKTTMGICALCVTPIFFASTTHSLPVAIALIAIAVGAHQGWSANVYTMSSDLFPKDSISSVMGIGGLAGALGGILLALSAGMIRVKFGYLPLFIIASGSYTVAWCLMCWLVPDWKSIHAVRLNEDDSKGR